jgi:hypothetical protein
MQTHGLTHYLVKWEIDVWAYDPTSAAIEALQIQRDADSSATVFEVVTGNTSVAVDLEGYV